MRAITVYTTKITGLISIERQQALVLIGISVGCVGLAGILYFFDDSLFQRFIGRINPLTAFFIISILGFIFLTYLLNQGWFAIYQKANLAGLVRYSGLAALFVITSIFVDLWVGFPAALNVMFPKSLMFYPAIGFLVEIIFHVLPLSILLICLTTIFKSISYSRILWVCIIIVALLEPAFQVVLLLSLNHFPAWAVAAVCLNLYVFNLSQLLIFRRYDFVSMYSFRLVYYLLWHILWGYIRLRILF